MTLLAACGCMPPVRRALAACPGCGRPSGAVKEWVSAQPKDVAFGGRPVSLVLVKRRLYCTGSSCRTGTCTEPVAAVALRCRVTTRLRGPDGAAKPRRLAVPMASA